MRLLGRLQRKEPSRSSLYIFFLNFIPTTPYDSNDVYFPKNIYNHLFHSLCALRRTTRIHKRRKFVSTLSQWYIQAHDVHCTTPMSYVYSLYVWILNINGDCSVLTSIHGSIFYVWRASLLFFRRIYTCMRVCVCVVFVRKFLYRFIVCAAHKIKHHFYLVLKFTKNIEKNFPLPRCWFRWKRTELFY